MSIVHLLAQAEQNPMGSMPVMLILMLVMMYFLIIRPQTKQRKALEARIASLEKGDKVITAGGLHATVHHISERTVTLKLSEGVFVPFEKVSIQSVQKASKGGSKEDASNDKDQSKEG